MSFIQKTANLFLLWLLVFAGAGLVGASVYFHETLDKVTGTTHEQQEQVTELSEQVSDAQATILWKERQIEELKQKNIELQEHYVSIVQQKDKLARQQAQPTKPYTVWSSRYMAGDKPA